MKNGVGYSEFYTLEGTIKFPFTAAPYFKASLRLIGGGGENVKRIQNETGAQQISSNIQSDQSPTQTYLVALADRLKCQKVNKSNKGPTSTAGIPHT